MSIAVVSITFSLVVALILYQGLSKTVMKNAMVDTRQIVNQVNSNLDYYINDIVNVASYARNLAKMSNELQGEEIKERMRVILSSRQDIETISLFSMEGEPLISTSESKFRFKEEIIGQEWFTRAQGGVGNFYFTGPHAQQLFYEKYPWVVTYSQQINWVDKNKKQQEGILAIDMNFSSVSELCQLVKLGKTGYVYLIDNQGKIVYHPRQQLLNSQIINEDFDSVNAKIFGIFRSRFENRNRLTIIETVSLCRWRIVGVAFTDELMEGMSGFNLLLGILLLFCIIVTIIIAQLVSNWITHPIKQLEKLMQNVEKDNFRSPPMVTGNKEVQVLSESFTKMVERIRSLMEDIISTQEMKRKFELDALQAKINPHFLYNTLDSVVWMAERGDTQGVIKMIAALARLFRVSISKGHDIITIQEELEHVRSYLTIQQMRYKDKFEFSIDFEEELANCPTIKLIIQPIVENSIYHGIKYLQEMGHIDIRVYGVSNKDILIEIQDNGIGMDKKTVSTILENDGKHLSDGNGIGVRNVHQRIQLYYGRDYGLSIESEQDVGTLVRIKIPRKDNITPIKVANR